MIPFASSEHLVPLPTSMYKSDYSATSKKGVSWPLPPPEMVQGAVKKVSPPKPDTPPTPVSTTKRFVTFISFFYCYLGKRSLEPLGHIIQF